MANILYIEDNDDNVYMLRRRLERSGHSVIVAGNGEEGVALACDKKPDLILMDLSLPVIDGWQATRMLKEMAATREIPVIALSAHAMPEDRERALDSGCDDYDSKPVDIQRLIRKIEKLLRRAEGT